ncbi:MAG TPA: hypothetical protein VGP68_20975 [Gemmataceae bacterium]|jgi:hypothetical protein|nr:hypothetical protein [Gemmataceae bacterium]
MAPEEIRDALRQQPFEPFRLVLTDGAAYEIPHPDLLLLGRRTAVIGLTGQPGQTFYERTVKVDLLHVVRIEPLQGASSSPPNGSN